MFTNGTRLWRHGDSTIALATATSRPPVRDIRDTVNPPRGFDQSAMLTSYRVWDYIDCFTSHVGEHRTVRGLWKRQGIPCFFKIPTVQQSAETEMPFVYVTLATHVTLATAGYTQCLFVYVTIGLARHNRTHVSQSERLLVKPQRPRTDLCAERVGLWSRLGIIALWGWFCRDVLPVTCCEHGPPSIATVHFSKFSIATNILFN